MLTHPIEKRNTPETRVNLWTWCERTVPPTRHWKTPNGPDPNFGPTTGKNLSKRFAKNSSSDKTRMVTWAMMNNQLITAQAIPPAWYGTVLFLESRDQQAWTCPVYRTLGRAIRNLM